jgi:phi LC3 family holin
MLNINLKSRLENKTFWVSLISAIILLLQQSRLTTLANYIPANYADIINTIFAIVTILGIAVDTSTPGISDQPATTSSAPTTINNTTVIASNDTSQQASSVATSTESQIQADTSNAQTDSSSQSSTQDSTSSASDSTNSVAEDIKNAIVVNSTITPKAATTSTEDINA